MKSFARLASLNIKDWQELFDHMGNEHGVILLESEMQEIAFIVLDSIQIPMDGEAFDLLTEEDKQEVLSNFGMIMNVENSDN